MRKTLLLLFAAFATLVTNAHDFEAGGIYYNITSEADKQAEVTYQGDDPYQGGCYSGSITIPATVTHNGVAYSVTGIGERAFYYCSRLTDITIPESVTSIGNYAFYDCSSLTTITLPESVTSIVYGAFYNCSSLTAVHISSIEAWCKISFDGDYSNPLYYAHNLYLNGELVTELVIPEGVTSIGSEAFYNCSSLTDINIPEGVTSIGDRTFCGCSSLTAITIPENSKLTSIGYCAFYYCSSLTDITIPENSKLTSIGESAFSGCSGLTAITIPEGVTSVGDCAFSGCSSLTSITVDEDNSAYDSRNGCNAIIETGTNTLIQGCATTIIPESVTSIGDYAFFGCSSLTSITLPESVTSIGDYAFYYCSSLTSITIPESVTSIGDYAFFGCSSLTSITLPESVTSIGDYAFYYCSSLTSITIPESVTSIGNSAFSLCSSLTTITIPEGVTSISDWAFRECRSLTSITIPESVTSIGSNAFSNCTGLTSITCYAETPPSCGFLAFYNTYKQTPIYVPAASISKYWYANEWKDFTNYQAIVVVTGVTLSQSVATLSIGEELVLTAEVAPNNAHNPMLTWNSSDPSIATVDNTGKVVAVASGTAIITASANDGSGVSAQCEVTVTPASYVITFLVDGEVILTNTLTRGSTINLPDVPEKEGYTFSGWSEVPETMPAKDVTVSGTFIVNKYLVTFMIDDVVLTSDSLEYGATITLPSTPPTREGYTFSGWGEVAETVPANDVTYSAYYIANVYMVYYFVGAKLVNMVKVTYGEPIPEYIYEPTTEGDEFLGWIGETYATMPAHDVTYTANICSDIKAMSTDKGQQTIVIYDLHGRRVTNPIKGGIYIVNGKKVVIK